MALTLSGTYTSTISLSNTGALKSPNPATVTSTGRITVSDEDGIFGDASAFWTLSNFGTIQDTGGSIGSGVDLVAGGTVTNAATALIAGYLQGVYISGGAGTVVNSGTIAGTGTTGSINGVHLNSTSGFVDNTAGGVIIDGVAIQGGAGTVINSGRISGDNGTAISFDGSGGNRLVLDPGYSLGGKAVGSTSAGATNTLELASAAGVGTVSGLGTSFVNFGAVAVDAGAQWTLTGANALGAGVTLSNAGTLAIVGTLALGGPVVNSGVTDIESGAALDLFAGGSGAGSIAFVGSGDVLRIGTSGAPATLSNAITVFAAGDTIDIGGLVANGATFAGGVLTLTNSGTVAARLTLSTPITNPVFTLGSDGSGGTLVMASGQAGIIYPGTYTSGIVLSNPATQIPATVTATGRVTNTTTAQSGDAVYGTNAAAWNFTNLGTIDATGAVSDGVQFIAGGSVANGVGALISGVSTGVAITGAAGTVANFGAVSATGSVGDAIQLGAGGSVYNGQNGSTAELITGAATGVDIDGGAGNITNFGTIASTATGMVGGAIFLYAGGLIANYGLITGARAPIGVGHGAAVTTLDTAATVRNLGTIASSATNASVGINLIHGGVIVNGAANATGALITGSVYGIYAGGHLLGGGGTYSYPTGALATVVNYGSIRAAPASG